MSRLVGLILVLMLGITYNPCVAATGWDQGKFIVTMWCPPPSTDENLKILARDGYTLTMVTSGNEKYNPIPVLDRIQKYGLQSLIYIRPLQNPAVLDNTAKKAMLIALIDKVKNHPAFYGYFLKDEPGAGTFAGLQRLSDFIRKHDPNHLIYINLYPIYANQQQLAVFLKSPPPKNVGIPDNFAGEGNSKQTFIFYQEYLRLFINMLRPQLVSYDHYHFLRNGRNGLQYFLNLDMIRTAALRTKLPFLNIVQASTIEKSWRLVNAREVRWLAYTTMAYGGRGISWFLYWGPVKYGGLYQDGRRMPLADDVAAVNREIAVLGPELMQFTSTGVYHSTPLPLGTRDMKISPVIAKRGEYIIGTFKDQKGNDVFMIVNRDYKKKSTATVTINLGNGQLLEFSLLKKQWQKIKSVRNGTRLRVPLRPGAGKLFKIVKARPD